MLDETVKRLCSYVKFKKMVENSEERLARMKSDEQFPAMRPSDGSKRNPGASDRMEYEDRLADLLRQAHAEMTAIEAAVFALSDPLEREVIQLRYLDGEGTCRLMRWSNVAINIYGDDDEKDLKAVYRLHGRALQSIRKGGLL